MSVSNQLPHWMAEKAAQRVLDALSPACERIAVAGSIRRKASVCGDIEIVAVARTEVATDAPAGKLFDEPRTVNRLHELTERIARGDFPKLGRPTKRMGYRMPAWGEKYRCLAVEYLEGRWMPVDLFIVQRKSWGPHLAIRTGPAAFSHLLVTQTVHGGAMPFGMRMKDGELQTRVDKRKPADDPNAWESLYLPEEPAFFGELKLPWIEPHLRSERALRAALEAAK